MGKLPVVLAVLWCSFVVSVVQSQTFLLPPHLYLSFLSSLSLQVSFGSLSFPILPLPRALPSFSFLSPSSIHRPFFSIGCFSFHFVLPQAVPPFILSSPRFLLPFSLPSYLPASSLEKSPPASSLVSVHGKIVVEWILWMLEICDRMGVVVGWCVHDEGWWWWCCECCCSVEVVMLCRLWRSSSFLLHPTPFRILLAIFHARPIPGNRIDRFTRVFTFTSLLFFSRLLGGFSGMDRSRIKVPLQSPCFLLDYFLRTLKSLLISVPIFTSFCVCNKNSVRLSYCCF